MPISASSWVQRDENPMNGSAAVAKVTQAQIHARFPARFIP